MVFFPYVCIIITYRDFVKPSVEKTKMGMQTMPAVTRHYASWRQGCGNLLLFDSADGEHAGVVELAGQSDKTAAKTEDRMDQLRSGISARLI